MHQPSRNRKLPLRVVCAVCLFRLCLLLQVPNIRAAQLGLEVECVLSACLTYSSTLGWQSAGASRCMQIVTTSMPHCSYSTTERKVLLASLLIYSRHSVFRCMWGASPADHMLHGCHATGRWGQGRSQHTL